MNRSEALPVCKAPWETIGFEKGKGRRKTVWKKSRTYRRGKCIPKSGTNWGKGPRLSQSCSATCMWN